MAQFTEEQFRDYCSDSEKRKKIFLCTENENTKEQEYMTNQHHTLYTLQDVTEVWDNPLGLQEVQEVQKELEDYLLDTSIAAEDILTSKGFRHLSKILKKIKAIDEDGVGYKAVLKKVSTIKDIDLTLLEAL